MNKTSRPVLAVTMGDPAGVGAEITVKTFARTSAFQRSLPFIIGSLDALEQAMTQTGESVALRRIDSIEALEDRDDVLQVLDPFNIQLDQFQMGAVSPLCGKAAVTYFETAIDLALEGLVQGIVTCPINKEAVHAAGFIGDIGHQEILARKTGSQLTATMLITPGLRVAHLSTHKSLAEAVAYVRTPVLVEKLKLTSESLQQWGISEPKVAVSALNPHGGEGGMLGREEIDEIGPAVVACQDSGLDVVGPYPADSIFYRAIAGEFDAVLALYHDQGHIAVKVHNFEDSITATMGIPFIRTSVDHGTAFDIAGQNKANPKGLAMALDMAVDMMNSSMT